MRLLWVGAAPGNAGGLGNGELGAHGTRIPFGGDIAGGNLDVLLASIGCTRNDTFMVASLNQLPERGGGEPSLAEMRAPVGAYPDSIALLRDTIIAAGAELIVALGNVALRACAAALTRIDDSSVGAPQRRIAPLRLPPLQRLTATGFQRGIVTDWPTHELGLADGFRSQWQAAWHHEPAPKILPLLHPSAQNMSPFAHEETLFHRRMVETRDALVAAVTQTLEIRVPTPRPAIPVEHGIYELPEWRERIAERHRRFDELWRSKGV